MRILGRDDPAFDLIRKERDSGGFVWRKDVEELES